MSQAVLPEVLTIEEVAEYLRLTKEVIISSLYLLDTEALTHLHAGNINNEYAIIYS